MPDLEINLPEPGPIQLVEIEPGVFVATEALRKREDFDFFAPSGLYPAQRQEGGVPATPMQG
jgi:hypothetical protein